MIQAYNQKSLIPSLSNVPFDTVKLKKGTSVSKEGSAFSLKTKGIYKIDFSIVNPSLSVSTGKSTSESNSNEKNLDLVNPTETLSFQPYVNGVPYIEGTVQTYVEKYPTVTTTISNSFLVQVTKNDCDCNLSTIPTNVTIKNIGLDAYVGLANIVITKVA